MAAIKQKRNSFGGWINRELATRDLQQRDLARMLDMSESYLSKLARSPKIDPLLLSRWKKRVKHALKQYDDETSNARGGR